MTIAALDLNKVGFGATKLATSTTSPSPTETANLDKYCLKVSGITSGSTESKIPPPLLVYCKSASLSIASKS